MEAMLHLDRDVLDLNILPRAGAEHLCPADDSLSTRAQQLVQSVSCSLTPIIHDKLWAVNTGVQHHLERRMNGSDIWPG